MAEPLLELVVEGPAHGGVCLARSGGRVVFVRHALPGERVRAQVTEDTGGSYLRADAVEVLDASPDRVPEPCPHARPGRCGGCDWQHATGSAQRAIKGAVVREQFARLGGMDVAHLLGDAEQLPGGLLGWRTRIAFAVSRDATIGLHRHRSHDLEPIGYCPLGQDGVGDTERVRTLAGPGITALETVRGENGRLSLVEHRPGPGRQARGRRPPDRVRVVDGPERLSYDVAGRRLEVAATGFWQVHPHALATITSALREALAPRPGETVLELYSGAGALTVPLALAVGPDGRVIGVESDRTAVEDAATNLAELPWASVTRGRVDAATIEGLDLRPDLVVLDPPRAGAGAAAIRSMLALAPRAIGYVSCDPSTLARDVRAAVEAGYELSALRAFDAFPMTAHVECLAVLRPKTYETTHSPYAVTL